MPVVSHTTHQGILDKRFQQRAAEFKASRPEMTTLGLGLENFAELRLARRSKQ
jgi:hypothetical protein